MSFNSTTFVFFFLAVFFGYWALSTTAKARFVLLLAANFVFYMSWNSKLIVWLLLTTVIDYYAARAIHRSEEPARRKFFLWLSLVTNLSLLGYFKYANFFAENFHAALQRFGLAGTSVFIPWNIVLPVGISFYTFQNLSYTVDVYRRELEPAKSLFKYVLFVTFFTHLVAGPIVRARDLLPQFERPARYDESAAARGVFLILVGLIKKIVLADAIGSRLVDEVYAAPGTFHPLEIALGVWGALFQFYLDFSAYSDIAIGAAACLGFWLPLNFDRPFLSQDIGEFWRRWHITMTTWFRDYVFIPLGGTRASRLGIVRNLMITLLLTGLWHGAGWNYVIWGEMYGVAMCLFLFQRRPTDEERARRTLWQKLWRRALTFNFVALSMLFFRNGTLLEGNRGIQGSREMLAGLVDFTRPLAGLDSIALILLLVAAWAHFSPTDWFGLTRRLWLRAPAPVQAAVLALVTGGLAAMAYQQSPFIYFQF